jgi:hypothetical protein
MPACRHVRRIQRPRRPTSPSLTWSRPRITDEVQANPRAPMLDTKETQEQRKDTTFRSLAVNVGVRRDSLLHVQRREFSSDVDKHNCVCAVRFPPPPRVLMGNREHRWRCAWSLVTLEDGARPPDGVADPDARWLRVRPEFEVLRTVVVPHAVSMMNGLAIEQIQAKQVLCHEYVLEHIRPTRRSRMTRCTQHHVPGLVPCTTTFPVAGSLSGVAPTDSTRRRLQLFRAIARAHTRRFWCEPRRTSSPVGTNNCRFDSLSTACSSLGLVKGEPTALRRISSSSGAPRVPNQPVDARDQQVGRWHLGVSQDTPGENRTCVSL